MLFFMRHIFIRYCLGNFLIAFLALMLYGCKANTDSLSTNENPPQAQLPTTVQPQNYKIDLTIIPTQKNFSGYTEIAVILEKMSKSIWLHGNQLSVNKAQVRLKNGDIVNAQYQQMSDIGVAKLTFDKPIPKGSATLVFDYTAPFNESLEGLYRVVENGENYAFTQFQTTSARLVFPGFDEPRFKVPMDITLEIEAKHLAVSNTPIVKKTLLKNGYKRIHFATTQPLPTYLIAFAVGNLDEVVWEPIARNTVRKTTLPLRGFTTKGKGDRINYALRNTEGILATLENYFGTPYPYEKLDIIAIPDFQAGAMENAGAITYREQLILLNDQAPVFQKRFYAEVHAHELAHQWFGNMVTPSWWDDIWLNEAFATWMAYKTMDTLEPGNSYAQKKLSEALGAMRHDSLISARQIRQPITEHGDISAAFDQITYEKGGAVLTMFERYIGEDPFKKGIQSYMSNFAFKNANAYDFIRAIATQRNDLADDTVESAFFSFLEQPGTPFVELGWQCTDNNIQVNVNQSRYLPLGSSGANNQLWKLPLCITYSQDGVKKDHCRLLEKRADSFSLPGNHCPDYIMPNADATGYYRWSVPQDKWGQLLSEQQLSDAEYLAVIDSLSASFHQGSLSIKGYLDTLPSLVKNNNNEVISAPLKDLRLILNEIVTRKQQQKIRKYLQQLYTIKLAGIGLDKTLNDENTEQLRNSIVSFLAKELDDKQLRKNLSSKAVAYTGVDSKSEASPGALNKNLRAIALYAAVQEQDSSYSKHLSQMALSSDDALLRQEILQALASSSDEKVVEDVRKLILSPQLRDNEMVHIVMPQMENPITRESMWKWLLAHFDQVIARLPLWAKSNIIIPAGYFCSIDKYNEIKTNLTKKITALEGGAKDLATTLEKINLCAALANEQRIKYDSQLQALN